MPKGNGSQADPLVLASSDEYISETPSEFILPRSNALSDLDASTDDSPIPSTQPSKEVALMERQDAEASRKKQEKSAKLLSLPPYYSKRTGITRCPPEPHQLRALNNWRRNFGYLCVTRCMDCNKRDRAPLHCMRNLTGFHEHRSVCGPCLEIASNDFIYGCPAEDSKEPIISVGTKWTCHDRN